MQPSSLLFLGAALFAAVGARPVIEARSAYCGIPHVKLAASELKLTPGKLSTGPQDSDRPGFFPEITSLIASLAGDGQSAVISASEWAVLRSLRKKVQPQQGGGDCMHRKGHVLT